MVSVVKARSDILQCDSAYVNLKTCSSDLVWLCVIGFTILFLLFGVEKLYRLGKTIGIRLRSPMSNRSSSKTNLPQQVCGCAIVGEPETAVKDEVTAPKQTRSYSDPFLISEKPFDHLRVMENGMAERIAPPPIALATSPQPFRLHSVFCETDASESENENHYVLGSPRISSTPRFPRLSHPSSPQKSEDGMELESLSEFPMPTFPSPVHI